MDLLFEMVERAADNINSQKEELLKRRMEQLKIPIPTKEELLKTRFNPLLGVQHDGAEYYYFNDGTKNGLFIIGFGQMNSGSFDFTKGVENQKFKIDLPIILEEPEFLKLPE